jgi:hypothetical protein
MLLSDTFPRGVVFRLTHRGSMFVVHWQWQQKRQEVVADSIEAAVGEALRVVRALETNGLV